MHQQADGWEALSWLLVSHLLWRWCYFLITKSIKSRAEFSKRISGRGTVRGLEILQNLRSNQDKELFHWWSFPGLCYCIVIAYYVLSGSKMIPEYMVQNSCRNMNVLSSRPAKVDGQITGICAQSLPSSTESHYIIGQILSSISLSGSLIAK